MASKTVMLALNVDAPRPQIQSKYAIFALLVDAGAFRSVSFELVVKNVWLLDLGAPKPAVCTLAAEGLLADGRANALPKENPLRKGKIQCSESNQTLHHAKSGVHKVGCLRSTRTPLLDELNGDPSHRNKLGL